MNENNKKWVDCWEKAGKELEKIKRKELRNFDYKKNAKLLDDFLEIGVIYKSERPITGLVEQQRLFNQLRK